MSFGLTFFGDMLVAVLAYAASIYTWPSLRTFFVSAESEIAALESKLAVLKSAVTPVKPPGT